MTQLLSLQEFLFGSTRLTGQLNQMAEAMATGANDATVFGGRTTIFKPGLKGYRATASGFWAATEDLALENNLVVEDIPISILLTDGTAGTPARSHKAMLAQLTRGPGQVGQLLPLSIEMAAMGGPVRGTVLHNASASGNVTGTAFQLGAVGATQFLYGIIHVFSGTGSFDVLIQSDNAQGFGSPTTRITFTNVPTGTPATYQWATPVAGAITDDWWRISATNPNTRDFAVIAAIQ